MFRTFVSGPLIAWAEVHFPRLMRDAHNREDALQTMELVLHMNGATVDLDSVRHALAWEEYKLGVVKEKPVCPQPDFDPDNTEHETLHNEIDTAFRFSAAA